MGSKDTAVHAKAFTERSETATKLIASQRTCNIAAPEREGALLLSIGVSLIISYIWMLGRPLQRCR